MSFILCMLDYASLDKSKIYVAFSSGDTWISEIIEKVSESPYSHSFLLHWDERFGTFLALGANVNGWTYTVASTENTLTAISLPVDLSVGLKKNAQWLGSMYDVSGLLGMSWVELCWHFLKRHVNNPLDNKRWWFCSEIVTQILEDSGLALGLIPSEIDPLMLRDVLMAVPGAVVHGLGGK